MNYEKMALKGLIADYKKRFKDLDLEASGLIVLIRQYISPYVDNVCTLEVDKATSSMERLNKIVSDMRELKTKIDKMEQDL